MKASSASWEKQASRRTVRRRLWFMALSTSELVADSLSASSVGGASGARLVFASASGPGVGTWLVEARLATSPDVVRQGLFVLKTARMLICPKGITPGKKRVRYTFAPASQSGPHFFVGLPGFGASCWRVAAGLAGHPECLPCKKCHMYSVAEVSKRGS